MIGVFVDILQVYIFQMCFRILSNEKSWKWINFFTDHLICRLNNTAELINDMLDSMIDKIHNALPRDL